MDLTLVTGTTLPEPDHDEQPLLDALAAAGVDARVAAWDDPSVDWNDTALTIVRSTWNYTSDRDGFLAWMRRASSASTVLRNPIAIMGPNTHKGYLAGLERADIPVVPTRWFARRGRAATADILRELPWDRIVAKPAIGAGSMGVRAFDLTSDEGTEQAATHIAALQQASDVLVQPQLDSIRTDGEHDIVWIDGECTHVVTKRSRLAGEDEHVDAPRAPTDSERQLVEAALQTLPEVARKDLLYARVDVAADDLGTLRVVELELVEPSLFLTLDDGAMQRLVTAIVRDCGKAS